MRASGERSIAGKPALKRLGAAGVMNVERIRSVSVISCAVSRVITVLLLGSGLVATSELAHACKSPDAGSDVPATKQSETGVRAFPFVALGVGCQLEYIGAFSADGKFKHLTKFGSFVDSMVTASLSKQPPPVASALPDAVQLNKEDVTKQVPPNIALPRDEQFVEDFQPPEHAVRVAKGHSVLEEFRDSIVSLAYGSEKVLLEPQSVTTDSRGRIIVTDAATPGLHVLAYTAKDSFQIVGGPGRRLQSPSGVAVDGDDNIYVSDAERGLVLVYDSEGRYVRSVGSIGDEGLFESPAGIAIDRHTGLLYVLDPPHHVLFILDHDGKVLARVGSADGTGSGFSTRAGGNQPGQFKDPQAVLVHNDELIVLDDTRVHILDLHGKFLKEFKISFSADLAKGPPPGVFMDADNRIYVSDPGSGTIRMYDHDGKFLRAFGRPGVRMGEFNEPAGMWADSTGRVYIVDVRRIQVFQFKGPK